MRNPRKSTRLLIRVSEVRDLYGLPNLSSLSQRYQPEAQKYQVLKYQPAKVGAAGILFASSTKGRGYNFLTDNANETLSLAAPGKETSFLAAPLTLAEYIVEVAP